MDLIYHLIAIMQSAWQAISRIKIDNISFTALIISFVAISFVLSLVRGKI